MLEELNGSGVNDGAVQANDRLKRNQIVLEGELVAPLQADAAHHPADVDYWRATTRVACGRTVETGYARSATYQVDCGACRRIIGQQQRRMKVIA